MCGHGLFFVFLLVTKIKTLLHAGSQIPIFVQSSSPYLKWFLRYVRVSKQQQQQQEIWKLCDDTDQFDV